MIKNVSPLCSEITYFYLHSVRWGSKLWEILHITRQVDLFYVVNFFLFCGRSPIVLSLPSSMFVMKLQNMLSSVHTEITDSFVVR